MIVSILALAVAFSPAQAQPSVASVNYVVSIVNERAGDDLSVRFVLSGPPTSYSSAREGDDIVVRIEAEALPGMTLPAPTGPIRSLALGPGPGFSLRLTLGESLTHEIVRESASLRLVLRKRAETAAPVATPTPVLDPTALPSPSPEPTPSRAAADPVAADTADLYRRLFPSASDPFVSRPVGRRHRNRLA